MFQKLEFNCAKRIELLEIDKSLVRRVLSVIWHHNGKMLEKALSGELSRKSKGNNTDSNAGLSQESTSESSPGDSETTELQVVDSQTDSQPSVPSPSPSL